MPKVLIVDGSGYARRALVRPLEDAGFDILEARDGEEGLSFFRQSSPDLVITDDPAMEGAGFLRAIREGGATTPVIVVGEEMPTSTRTACENLGVAGFLPRTCDATSLRDLVSSSLKKAA